MDNWTLWITFVAISFAIVYVMGCSIRLVWYIVNWFVCWIWTKDGMELPSMYTDEYVETVAKMFHTIGSIVFWCVFFFKPVLTVAKILQLW